MRLEYKESYKAAARADLKRRLELLNSQLERGIHTKEEYDALYERTVKEVFAVWAIRRLDQIL